MQRRTRNRICIWIIFGGLLNLFAYTVVYAQLGGDAKNGGREQVIDPTTGEETTVWYLSGHYIHGTGGKRTPPVNKGIWVYSYLHSISLWPTQAVMMICMLILARPHIIATMGERTWIRGGTLITVAITGIGILYSALTIWFTMQFAAQL